MYVHVLSLQGFVISARVSNYSFNRQSNTKVKKPPIDLLETSWNCGLVFFLKPDRNSQLIIIPNIYLSGFCKIHQAPIIHPIGNQIQMSNKKTNSTNMTTFNEADRRKILESLTADELATFQEAFTVFDKNQDGTITTKVSTPTNSNF